MGISQIIADILADEGWVWVEPNGRRIRSVSGKVHNVHVANNDLFANHDSHDVDFELRVDPGQEDMLSPVSGDADENDEVDSIGIEWESGIHPAEKTGDGEMSFTGATFDFYLRHDQTYTFRANGMEQDCMDDWFGFQFDGDPPGAGC